LNEGSGVPGEGGGVQTTLNVAIFQYKNYTPVLYTEACRVILLTKKCFYFTSKCTKIRFMAGLFPDLLGSIQQFPVPLIGLEEPQSRRSRE